MIGPEGEMEAVRLTVPSKLLTLVTTMLALALAPLWIPRGLGVIIMVNRWLATEGATKTSP